LLSKRGHGVRAGGEAAGSGRTMTRARWEAASAQRAEKANARRELEEAFNAEIIRRYEAGQSKEEIVADMRITRELFNRVVIGDRGRMRAPRLRA